MKRNWTKEEIEYLESAWGRISIPKIAKALNRSVDSVIVKKNRMKLGAWTEGTGEYITVNQLCKLLGKSNASSWTKEKFVRDGLNIKMRRIGSKKNKFAMVKISDFWEWAENNQDKVNFLKLEPNTFGDEPEWVEQKRKNDQIRRIHFNPKSVRWTRNEEERLVEYCKQGKYTYYELTQIFHRTSASISRKLNDLKTPYRPIPCDNHIRWTAEEENLLITEMIKGTGSEVVAKMLQRSDKTVKTKLKRMCDTWDESKARKYLQEVYGNAD